MIVTAQYVQNTSPVRYVQVNNVVPGKEYLIGYNDGSNLYLIMNYNPDPLTSPNGTSNYKYTYSSTHYAYGIKAVVDENGYVTDIDRSIYPNACIEYAQWKFITTSAGYRIRSMREATMYLTAHVNKKYAHLYVLNGYNNATDWNWNSSNAMTYTLKGGALKYMSFVPTVNGYHNFFKAGTNIGSIVLYRRVENVSSYVVTNEVNATSVCINVN